MWASSVAGVSLPHNAEMQREVCRKVENPIEGDLVMFDFRSPPGGAATHVGLWVRPGILLDTRNPDGEPVAYREIEKPPFLLGFWRPPV
jgi:cell wall-associated NlpC family hydrolase